jgi:transcriptional regulator with XRE-family HTH domain
MHPHPTPDEATGIGERLRELRRARGLNQQDLASGDISVSYVSLIETGKRTPSPAVLEALAERVGCSPEYLRTGKNDTRAEGLQLKIAFADMAMRNGANGEALQAYSEALASAPFLSQESVKRARLGQALALEKLGRLEAAIQSLTTLWEDPDTVAGSAEWAQLAVALCRCYREAGDFTLSVEIGEQAMRRLDVLGLDTTDDHIQLAATLVSAYLRRGDLTKAQLLAERIMRRADASGSRVARGSIYWNASVVAHSRGATQEALALAERALALMAESDNVRHQSLLKAAYGMLLLESEQPDAERAVELFTQAHEQLIEVGTASEQAMLETYLAQAKLATGYAREAQEHASRALGLLRNEPRWEAVDARATLSQAQFVAGDADQAKETLHTAAAQLRQVVPGRSTAGIWRKIGDLWEQFGAPEQALTAYQQALSDAGLRSWTKAAERSLAG